MNNYRFSLEKYTGKKYVCPECSMKTFVRYIDNDTGNVIADIVGKCERVNSCNYHLTPKQYFENNNISYSPRTLTAPKPQTPQQQNISFIPFEMVSKSMKNTCNNNFVKYLQTHFNTEIAKYLCEKYHIGTDDDNCTIFWKIDKFMRVRTGKIMKYDLIKNIETFSGYEVKRQKYFNYIHTKLKLDNFNLQQCFFGEHLLKDNTKPVAIVESEKTAIICSVYFDKYTWIATSGNNNLKKLLENNVLKHSVVKLYPDANMFNEWQKIAKTHNFDISDLLEKKLTDTERLNGYDIADYLIKYDWKAPQKKDNVNNHSLFTENFIIKIKKHKENHLPTFAESSILKYCQKNKIEIIYQN